MGNNACCEDGTKPEFQRKTYAYKVLSAGEPANLYEQIGFRNDIKEPELIALLKR
jgi:hypothetical protein